MFLHLKYTMILFFLNGLFAVNTRKHWKTNPETKWNINIFDILFSKRK